MNKVQWRKIYRMARTPDSFLADPVVLDFPVRYLFMAIDCLEKRSNK